MAARKAAQQSPHHGPIKFLHHSNTIAQVATTELTEDPEDNGEDGVIILEIESHEEGYLAKILLQEGETAECDTAIAVVCENDADVAAFADFPLGRCIGSLI